MTQLKKLLITSFAFLALAVLLGAVTAPYFREAEREAITHSATARPA